MRKIGILGGTFDPPHFGHLHIALSIMEIKALDEVWFCPARRSPHKLHRTTTSPLHRLAMVECAVEEIPQFKVIQNEIARDPPSYTVNTLKDLLVTYPDDQFSLLLGEDAAATFTSWRDPQVILSLVDVYTASRQTKQIPLPLELEQGRIPLPILDISSTEIRSRLMQGLYCGHLVPASTLRYISNHNIYL